MIQRVIAATESRLATATANGRCSGLRAADPFTALRRQRQAAKGVAA
jgi:hypothetical protein